MNRKKTFFLSIPILFGIVLWNTLVFPEDHFKKQIQEPIDFPNNMEIEKVKDSQDLAAKGIQTLNSNVPAQDEILLQEELNRAFVASIDGFIWIVDLKTNQAEPFVKTPLLPGGMVANPKNPDLIYFCASRGNKNDSTDPDGPGIYELRISNKQIRKIGTRVPKIPNSDEKNVKSLLGKFYTSEKQPSLRFDKMTNENSRAVEKSDDLAISNDGERIYFTEPYDHVGAILGVSVQSRSEALTLGKNGNLWKFDLKENTASLVAHNYSYLDGILLEYSPDRTKESSILVNELSKFRLIRLHLLGERSGEDEIVIEGLPGFPDGMDRDPQGRIWIALAVERSKLITWLHNHPFWKKIVLYIPENLQPVSRKTGLLVLSKDGTKPLYYVMHNGSLFSTLIVVVPGKKRIFLSVYEKNYKGLNVIPYPI
ncbi:hypothetical protein A0128_12140 [Leptospira tipperaryensis]|uniref:SMP-30/gluconolaconase/LRE-like region n=1 Tax=Leptospira tipperaryensis TaxID=2564040 RepID=A0A1D7UY82_9LEPT|nr:hypothetical protein [Leptospira tipperaryensis]AOP34530.1 hypothetical protein A0128_12140 [Leptospira tipperaryensis]